ncbi:MAG: hypothetical protein ABI835_14280, partial [Chloroflexota bacterium]
MDDTNFDDPGDLNETNESQRPDLDTTLTALRDNDGSVNKTLYYGLSMLEQDDIRRLAPIWTGLKSVYRRKLLRELVEASEANFELDYHTLAHFALDDTDPGVREAAIELLWEDMSIGL